MSTSTPKLSLSVELDASAICQLLMHYMKAESPQIYEKQSSVKSTPQWISSFPIIDNISMNQMGLLSMKLDAEIATACYDYEPFDDLAPQASEQLTANVSAKFDQTELQNNPRSGCDGESPVTKLEPVLSAQCRESANISVEKTPDDEISKKFSAQVNTSQSLNYTSADPLPPWYRALNQPLNFEILEKVASSESVTKFQNKASRRKSTESTTIRSNHDSVITKNKSKNKSGQNKSKTSKKLAENQQKRICCNHCTFITSTTNNLLKHFVRNHGNVFFGCHLCSYKTRCKTTLGRHLNRNHKIEQIEARYLANRATKLIEQSSGSNTEETSRSLAGETALPIARGTFESIGEELSPYLLEEPVEFS